MTKKCRVPEPQSLSAGADDRQVIAQAFSFNGTSVGGSECP